MQDRRASAKQPIGDLIPGGSIRRYVSTEGLHYASRLVRAVKSSRPATGILPARETLLWSKPLDELQVTTAGYVFFHTSQSHPMLDVGTNSHVALGCGHGTSSWMCK